MPVPCFICSFKGNRKNIISLLSLEGYTRVINENKIFKYYIFTFDGLWQFLIDISPVSKWRKRLYIKLYSDFQCFALALIIPCIILKDLCCSSLKDIFGGWGVGVFLFFVFCLNLNLLFAVRHVPCTQYLLEIRPCGSGGDEIWTFNRY